jgi:hypothetical protein
MRRKKWSEEEEQTLISKYGEMAQAGTLAKLKTREKKFEPIAAHVNAIHHSQDNVSFPWEWSWRDLSVKIQNMRNQYLGVKQKIRRPPGASVNTTKDQFGGGGQQGSNSSDEYDWTEGIVHWSNFLRYKEVFGDVELDSSNNGEQLGNGGAGSPSSTLINKSFNGDGIGSKPNHSNGHGHGNGARGGRSHGGRLSEFSSRAPRQPGHGHEAFNNDAGNSRAGGNLLCEGEVGPMVGNGGNMVEGEDLTPVGGEGGGVSLSGLVGLECYADGDNDHGTMMMPGEVEEDLGSKKKKMKRQHNNRDPMSSVSDGGGHLSTEGKILAFLGAYITEQRERDAQREAREREKDREREERELLREAAEREREQNRLERERIREEQDRRRQQEREDREWERDLVNRDRWEEEKQKERAWEEKREEEKQEWRERMTTLQLGHQAAIAQMQAQMVQSQQNVISLLLGVFLHGSPVEETPGQRSSLALQILHNLQQQQHAVGGAFQSVGIERKGGGIEDTATQYVMDGENNMTGAH